MRLKAAIEAAALEEPRREADGELVGRYRFAEDFPGFAGHFPGYPIVPAVVQVRMAQTLFERGNGRSFSLRGVDHAKFLLQLLPLQELEVRCREREGGEQPVVEGRLMLQGALAATFVLHLAGAGDPQ